MRGTYEEVRAARVEASRVEGDRYRALAARQDREVNDYWWIIDHEEIGQVVHQAVRRVSSKFDGKYVDQDDLIQDAYIAIVTTANLQQPIDAEEWGLLQFRLEQDLTDMLDTLARRGSKSVSLDALTDAALEASVV